MKITFLMCGKTCDKWVETGMDVFVKRLKNYINFELKVLPDLKNSSKLSFAEIKSLEGEQILSFVNQSDFLILLDENGTLFSSQKFAQELQKQMNAGRKHLIFSIGGPYGFSKEVYDRANAKISLSPMTFSHQIVRPIFLEQLYRAFTILNNEPYHHS